MSPVKGAATRLPSSTTAIPDNGGYAADSVVVIVYACRLSYEVLLDTDSHCAVRSRTLPSAFGLAVWRRTEYYRFLIKSLTMMERWISLVPPPMVEIFPSRQ